MNRNKSNWSSMGALTNIEKYNKSVEKRDERSLKIIKIMELHISECPDNLYDRRLVYDSLKDKYPLYEYELSSLMQKYWNKEK